MSYGERKPGGASIVGRERELAAIDVFLSGDEPSPALVLEGSAGMGKTTLWEAGIRMARSRRMRVLTARSSDAETQLSFAGLMDLLDGIDTAALRGVPTPQVRALDVALVRAEPM